MQLVHTLLGLCDPESEAGLKCRVCSAPSAPAETKPETGRHETTILPSPEAVRVACPGMLRCGEQLCKGKITLRGGELGILLRSWQENQPNKGKRLGKSLCASCLCLLGALWPLQRCVPKSAGHPVGWMCQRAVPQGTRCSRCAASRGHPQRRRRRNSAVSFASGRGAERVLVSFPGWASGSLGCGLPSPPEGLCLSVLPAGWLLAGVRWDPTPG